jgi:hypothetical protein
MPFDPNDVLTAITKALPKLPSALIAAALLGGPTAIWIITRIVRPPSLIKTAEEPPEDLENLLWVCESCRSMNEDRLDRCYRCHLARTAEETPAVIHAAPETAMRPGLAVGSGVPASAPAAYTFLGAQFAGATRPVAERYEPEPPTPAPDPLGALEPLILEPRVKVSGRAARTPAAKRKPAETTAPSPKRTRKPRS